MSTPLDELIARSTPLPWYVPWLAKGSEPIQGTVASEPTGATVAITYDPKDAPIIAHAVKMLVPLRDALDQAIDALSPHRNEEELQALIRMRATLAEANNPEVKS